MTEGSDYISFIKPGHKTKTKITSQKADDNYLFWVKKLDINVDPKSEHPEMYAMVSNLFGNHTFPFKIYLKNCDRFIYPIYDLFEKLNCPDSKRGLLSNRKRGIVGQHMSTATELGLDNLIFSYLGVHDPYHRLGDPPPPMPFGLYLDAGHFAYTHGNPWDRDYKDNDNVDKNELEYYFLKHDDLKKLITWRIENDPIFDKNFWRYFGTTEFWNEEFFLKQHWKNKAELCFYEIVPVKYIKAILWPVWEAGTTKEEVTADELQEFASAVRWKYNKAYNKALNIILYRPYGDIINESNWESMNQADMELNLVRASQAVQEHYLKYREFPESV